MQRRTCYTFPAAAVAAAVAHTQPRLPARHQACYEACLDSLSKLDMVDPFATLGRIEHVLQSDIDYTKKIDLVLSALTAWRQYSTQIYGLALLDLAHINYLYTLRSGPINVAYRDSGIKLIIAALHFCFNRTGRFSQLERLKIARALYDLTYLSPFISDKSTHLMVMLLVKKFRPQLNITVEDPLVIRTTLLKYTTAIDQYHRKQILHNTAAVFVSLKHYIPLLSPAAYHPIFTRENPFISVNIDPTTIPDPLLHDLARKALVTPLESAIYYRGLLYSLSAYSQLSTSPHSLSRSISCNFVGLIIAIKLWLAGNAQTVQIAASYLLALFQQPNHPLFKKVVPLALFVLSLHAQGRVFLQDIAVKFVLMGLDQPDNECVKRCATWLVNQAHNSIPFKHMLATHFQTHDADAQRDLETRAQAFATALHNPHVLCEAVSLAPYNMEHFLPGAANTPACALAATAITVRRLTATTAERSTNTGGTGAAAAAATTLDTQGTFARRAAVAPAAASGHGADPAPASAAEPTESDDDAQVLSGIAAALISLGAPPSRNRARDEAGEEDTDAVETDSPAKRHRPRAR